jgi:hypothetical protein
LSGRAPCNQQHQRERAQPAQRLPQDRFEPATASPIGNTQAPRNRPKTAIHKCFAPVDFAMRHDLTLLVNWGPATVTRFTAGGHYVNYGAALLHEVTFGHSA